MNEFVAGLDGGGTKTAIEIRDLEGNVIASATAGPLNYNSQTKEELCKTMDTIIEIIHNIPGGIKGCKSLCISTAGISNKEAITFIKEYVQSGGITCDIMIVGDHEAALYGAIGKPDGIILISGTGSICFGKNIAGSSCRTGGYGHLIDDEGSGYAIGRDILAAAVRAYDNRISNTVLLELVLSEINGCTIQDIIRYTYKPNWNKTDIAKLAPLLLKALSKEDEQAKLICNKASDELVKLVLPVAKQLELEQGNLALLGGILNHYEPIRTQLIEKLGAHLPKLQIIKPQNDSVTGAVLIALERYKQQGL